MIKFLHKKNVRTEYGHYSGISLVAHSGKVPLLEIVAMILGGHCNVMGLLTEEQYGFHLAPLNDGHGVAELRVQEL